MKKADLRVSLFVYLIQLISESQDLLVVIADILVVLRSSDVDACARCTVNIDILSGVEPGREVTRSIRSITLVEVLTDHGDCLLEIHVCRIDRISGLRLLRLLFQSHDLAVLIESCNCELL